MENHFPVLNIFRTELARAIFPVVQTGHGAVPNFKRA